MPSDNENLKVAVRVRPFNEREKRRAAKCIISMNDNSTTITNPNNGDTKLFAFDYSYWSHDGFIERENGELEAESSASTYADQKSVFDDLGKGVLENAWEGYNATLFAYGQTGSGKSYSMIGHGSNKGIVPITCGHLFKEIDKVERKKKEIQVSFSMLEIYNEQIRDLLNSKSQGKNTNLKVRERNKIGFYVEGLSSHPCQNYKTIEYLMEVGAISRTTASTNMNATSSRSHMVITIKFKQVFRNSTGASTAKESEINLVDLAGSERANSTGASGDRLKEGSAINKSLLMLGSVIEKLAAGNSRVVIPYRDSTLTKLLKSALGGNSKTVMIAALSPADINYDETLSTLRYADRAKKIKNRAVINESSTDRLIRELKAENAKLLAQLNKRSSSNTMLDSEEVKRLISQNELQMKELSMTWEQKLEAARLQWEKEQKMTANKDENLKSKYPYLQNVNEDPQLSGIIKHFIYYGVSGVGKSEQKHRNTQHTIVLKSLGIQQQHCLISCSESTRVVIIEPYEQADVTINGIQVLIETRLKHGDRLKLGSNALFLFYGFPDERGSIQENLELAKLYNYEYFQNEFYFATDLGQNVEKSHGKKTKRTIDDPVFLEYIELMPVVACLNVMSEEMGKPIVFSLLVKNLTTCDEYGQDLKKEIIVQLQHQVNHQVWMWSKDKFEHRRFMIEELYMKFLEDSSSLKHLPRSKDPFWDPVEDIYLGCAHMWLHSLAYRMSCDEQATFNNHSGGEEGSVDVSIYPCSQVGKFIGEDMLVMDPNTLLGKQYDVMIDVQKCNAISWVKTNSTRGLMLRYWFYKENSGYRSCTKWNSANPKVHWKERFTIKVVEPDFLRYLQSAALVVELWGLQDGRSENSSLSSESKIVKKPLPALTSSLTPSTSSDISNIEVLEEELSNAKIQLEALDESNKDLRNICNDLKKENAQLKKKVQARATRRAATAYSNPREYVNSAYEERMTSSSKVQAEMGKALKAFFGEVKHIQNDLRDVSSSKSESESEQILQISQNLDHILVGLKGRVTTAIRTHKMEKKYPNGKILTR